MNVWTGLGLYFAGLSTPVAICAILLTAGDIARKRRERRILRQRQEYHRQWVAQMSSAQIDAVLGQHETLWKQEPGPRG